MTNPIPRIGPDGTIRCMNHPELTAVALQCAAVPSWSDAASKKVRDHTPLIVTAPIADFDVPFAHAANPHAIFWSKVSSFFEGNASLGMCAECAYKFWLGLEMPPLYINQHAIFSSHVTIAKTEVVTKVSPHTFSLMRIETPTGLSNKVELVCPDCINNLYPGPARIEIKQYSYE